MKIVFLTTSKEFAIDAFGVRAYDYILKPLNKQQVFKCIERLIGDIKATPTMVCKIKTSDYNITTINVKDITYQPEMDLHISCDFNVDPMCWVLAHKTEDKVFYFDEIVLENTTTAKACEEFCNRYPNHKGQIIINGDASGDNRSCTSEYTNYVIIKKKI